jgi:Protein of unknown function (DUF664)
MADRCLPTVLPCFAIFHGCLCTSVTSMTRSRVRPAFVADERTQLLGWLNMQRELVHWKCEGLSNADARRSVLPSSPLMTMAGVVSHLRWVEHCWFEVLFLGRPAEGPQFQEEPEDADMIVDGVAFEQLLRGGFVHACAGATIGTNSPAGHAWPFLVEEQTETTETTVLERSCRATQLHSEICDAGTSDALGCCVSAFYLAHL